MTTDNHGQPQARGEDQDHRRTAQDTPQAAEQTVTLNTAQAAAQLGGVDPRTVRRWITVGLLTVDGTTLRLEARQVHSKRGTEYSIDQTALERFKEARDRAATEGQPAGQLAQPESQALALQTSIQAISDELERRGQALSQAQETIERLALQAGREAGRSQELERELETARERLAASERERELAAFRQYVVVSERERELAAFRERLAALERERDQWQRAAQESQAAKKPRATRLLPWQKPRRSE
jgi:hypothetical protein